MGYKYDPESQYKKDGGGFGPPRGLRVQYQIPKNPVVPTKEEMERKYTRQVRYERQKERR